MFKWYLGIILTLIIHGFVISRTNGRISRWGYFLTHLFIIGSIGIVIAVIFLTRYTMVAIPFRILLAIMIPVGIYWLLKFDVLRLHDIELSGWYSLLLYIPIAGQFLKGIMFLKNGTDDVNQYDELVKFEILVNDDTTIIEENSHCIDIEGIKFYKRAEGYLADKSSLMSINGLQEYLESKAEVEEDLSSRRVRLKVGTDSILEFFKPYIIILDQRRVVVDKIEFKFRKIDLKYFLSTSKAGVDRIRDVLEEQGLMADYSSDGVLVEKKSLIALLNTFFINTTSSCTNLRPA